MPFKRLRDDSDYDADYEAPKRLRQDAPSTVQRALSLPPSSPPAALSLPPSSPPAPLSLPPSSPPAPGTPENIDDARTPEFEQPPEPPITGLLSFLPRTRMEASGSTPRTPQRAQERAQSIEPRESSPMAFVDLGTLKSRRGRPAYTPNTRHLKQTMRKTRSSQRSPDRRKFTEASEELGRRIAEKERLAKERLKRELEEQRLATKRAQAIADAEETRRAQSVFEQITADEADGGFNFDSLDQFFDALWRPGGDPIISSKITRYIKRHGAEHAAGMFKRSEGAADEYISSALGDIFQREGHAIQEILTRDSTTTVTELLKEFSMEQLGQEIQAVAPTLWAALVVLATPERTTRREADGEARRNKPLVFTTICALISVLRSQRANNFQLVIGLFLLGSGASKREISVLAHAGLSISYQRITEQVKKLSAEGMLDVRALVKSGMVQIVWDNLNIAFRVAAQRLKAKNHFDNGTTGTVMPVFDPATGGQAAHGTLPLDMKPPRERTLPVLDWTPDDVLPSPESAAQLSESCFWQLKRMALDHIPGVRDDMKKQLGDCPEVYQIPLHKTPQLQVPAMKIDESTLDGTGEVRAAIYGNIGLGDEELEVHGLVMEDGDLMTHGLKDKLESARRNSTTPIAGMRSSVGRWGIFHGQMAGGRLTVNEHWGTPNSPWPGGLWWEHNKLLKRKPLAAGWGGKKATEWQPAHELIHISLPAHIVDGFRIHCGHGSLKEWAASATFSDFEAIARKVFDELFSTAAVNKLRACEDRDITLENTILFNRDALFYVEFGQAIKKGDIGRVLNVLSIWMVMMRSPKTMPRYADAIFETLVKIKSFPPKLQELYLVNWLVNITGRLFGFKPVDLLQEHQNFWAKIIYTAKGTNKSWKWLSMITVCIFTIREAMRTVQTAFEIPAYGEKHKTPPIDDEVTLIAGALKADRIQSYVQDRPANDHVTAVRDLIQEGALYANTRKAFHRFTRDTRKPEMRGFDRPEGGVSNAEEGEEGEEDDGDVEDYEPTEEDLRVDDEEFLMEPDAVLAAALRLMDDVDLED